MARLTPRVRVLLILLLLAAWAWRLYGLDFQSLWRDEVDSLRFATRPLPQVLANFTRPGENGPLYFLLLRPWLAVAGHTEYALRFTSVLAGLLGIALAFVWGRRLFGVGVGILAGLLLAVNPYHLWYSQEAKMYALLVVVIPLALWVFAQAVERGRWQRWALWFVCTSLCFYIHVLGVLVIPLQIAWLLLVPKWRRRWRSFALALALLVLPYVPLVWWQWTLLTDPDFRTGHLFAPFGRLLLTLFSVQIQGIPTRPGAWIFAPPIFLLLGVLFLGPHEPPRSSTPPELVAAAAPCPLPHHPALAAVHRSLPDLDPPGAGAAPGRWSLAGSAGEPPPGRGARAHAIGVQLWVGWRQMSQPIKSDFRAAAAYTAPRRQPDDLVLFLMPYIHFTYRYYDPGAYPWAEAPYANREPDASLIPERMTDLTADYTGVWLVESESDFYDRQGLIRAWLDAHGQRDDQAHFARVTISHYRLQP